MSSASTTTIAHYFAEIGVRHTKDHRLGDAWNRHKGAFDRHRRDVLAAPDDHVLAPPGDPEVALVVEAPQITSVEPAVRSIGD